MVCWPPTEGPLFVVVTVKVTGLPATVVAGPLRLTRKSETGLMAVATLAELFAWDEDEFLRRTEGSAIRRSGHERWLRNIAVALGNAPKTDAVMTALESRRDHTSPVVREHAGIADDQIIMKSIALGWPDESFPANAVVSERKSVDDAAVFVGFED